MAELKNIRHEKFACIIASGETPAKAYTAAGYAASSLNVAGASAHKLLKLPKIIGRLKELKPLSDSVAEQKAAAIAEVVEDEVMTSIGRARALAVRRQKIIAIIKARSEYPEIQWAPGGDTGLVVTTEKPLGKFGTIRVYEVDTALLRELRETEKQIAIELKQWTEQVEATHIVDTVELVKRGAPEQVSERLEELKRLKQELLEGARTGQIQ